VKSSVSLFVAFTVGATGALSEAAQAASRHPAKPNAILLQRTSKPSSVEVLPAKVVLSGKWASQQLLVSGKYKDGSSSDLTSSAQFKSDNNRIATVDRTGVIRPVADGETTITVTAPGAPKGRLKIPVTVKDSRLAAATFLNHIEPAIGKLGCNTARCHGAGQGKGSLKLALFGGDPMADYNALTREAGGRRIDRVHPDQSLLLLKASGAVSHAGGGKLTKGGPEYEMVLDWLRQGAPWRALTQPDITALRVLPGDRILHKGETQRLLATAVFSDGSERDVTRDASFIAINPKVASVSGSGVVKAEDYGETFVIVNYLRQAAVMRITVPQPLPQPFPKLKANNRIDELVYAKLKSLGIPPSDLATDHEFLRRVYLDVIGLPPSAEEAKAFLQDPDPRKRAKLIDQLLEREEFADFWALKWGDLLRIKSEYPVRLWPKAVAVYYRWVRESIAQNKPYDQFVKELLISSGSNFRSAPANFYRAVQNKDPQTIAETTALVFMGARLSCARCHAHPTEPWGLTDDLGMAAFFSKLAYKSTLEWKEEIVFIDPRKTFRDPMTREVVVPKFLGGATAKVEAGEDPRPKFAQWLTSPDNPWFSKNIVNRIWFWLLGRGIIYEPDDIRTTNPPENPELLHYLASELVAKRFDLKHIYRLILNSRTYQTSSIPNPWNAKDYAHFSHYPVKRLTAEQLLDSISLVTGVWEKFTSRIPEPYSNWPEGYRATQISDGNTECPFLDLFGRPLRDTPYESERSSDFSLRQALYLINSEQLEAKITGSPRLKQLLASSKPDAELVDELYLSMLSRFPTTEEKQRALDYLAKYKNAKRQAVNDLVWAVLNTKEFVFNH